MAPKVVVTPDMFHKEAEARLRNAGIDVVYSRPTRNVTEEELQELIADADAYIAGANRVSAETIGHGKRLKVIARFGVGYDAVDWKHALAQGIPVTITPGTNEQSVADMAFALMLGISRRIPYFDRSVKAGEWTPNVLGQEIWSKTIGIVGTGRIGKAVAKRARGFDMNIVAYDTYPDHAWAEQAGVRYMPLEQLLPEADYVTLHLPLTEETQALVNASFLSQMKKTAFLINTARGQLVDEEALHEALTARWIAGAALDVYLKEPLPKEHKLLGLENGLFTCHVSSHTQEAMKRMSLLCADEVIRAMQGLPPQHPIPEWTRP